MSNYAYGGRFSEGELESYENGAKVEMLFASSLIGNAAEWKSVVNDEVKMQVDTGADTTVISSRSLEGLLLM